MKNIYKVAVRKGDNSWNTENFYIVAASYDEAAARTIAYKQSKLLDEQSSSNSVLDKEGSLKPPDTLEEYKVGEVTLVQEGLIP
jgi:hypothetical protein